jgi:hypothetical protein
MGRSQLHLLVNSLFTVLVFAIAIIITFLLLQNDWHKGVVLVFFMIGSLFFAHKGAPHLTGHLAEKLCEHFGIER